MKNLLQIILSILLISASLNTNAQTTSSEKNPENTIYLGYIPHMVFDVPNVGFHIGYNVVFPFQRKLFGEAQLSYSVGIFKGGSEGFFQQGEGNYQVLNSLVGGRYYFLTKEKQKANVYVNALIGGSYYAEKELQNDLNGSVRISNGFDLGYSVGVYRLTKSNISFGIAVETAFTATLKVGYIF